MSTKSIHRASPSIAILLLCLVNAAIALAASAPMSLSQLALYQGADRGKILVEGAKKEGHLTLYDSHKWFRTFVKEFEKKYPFIKVSEWRNDSKNVIRRAMEEFKSPRNLADVVETTVGIVTGFSRIIFLEHCVAFHETHPFDDVKSKGKNGLYYLGDRETYNSLGFNTNVIGPNDAPRTLKELLDPKWKGKMSIVSTSTGVRSATL
jgi:iron(III) transport system substrate-binding protein